MDGAAHTGPGGGQGPLPTVAIALAVYAALVWRFDWLCDDAYITFRYARNLAEGHGLVFHPGIDQPVEGYSEYLWALLLAAGMKLGVGPELLSRVLSVAAGAWMVVLTARLADGPFGGPAEGRRSVARLVAPLFVATAPPVAVWATGGMATMPAAALCLALFAAVHRPGGHGTTAGRRALVLGLLGAAMALVRADGALLVALVLGPPLLVGLTSGRTFLWRSALGGAALAALAFLAHMAWRWSTYGDWVPNTARVKLGASAAALGRGADYVLSCALAMPGLPLAAALGAAGLVVARRSLGPALALGTALVPVGVVLYAITSGGDFMAFGRFLLPAVPFVALAMGALLVRLERRAAPLAAGLGLVAVAWSSAAAWDVHVFPASVRARFDVRHNQRLSGVAEARSELEQWRNMRDRALEWGRLGRALRVHAPREASLVYGAVGAVGYFSGLFLFDQNGLVTREVALLPPHADLRSPGHDKNVPPTFFLKDDPTFLTAGVAPRGAIEVLRERLRGLGALEVLGPTEGTDEVLWVVRPR